MAETVLSFPARDFITAPLPIDHKPGDKYDFVVIGDDAFAANLSKGRIVMARIGEEREYDLHVINLPGARDLVRYTRKQSNGSLSVECARYPTEVYEQGEWEIVGAVVQFRGFAGGWWSWIPDGYFPNASWPLVDMGRQVKK